MKEYRGNRGKAPLVPNFCIRSRTVINIKPRTLHTYDRARSSLKGGLVGPTGGLEVLEKGKYNNFLLSAEKSVFSPTRKGVAVSSGQ